MSTRDLEPVTDAEPTDDKILAARVLLQIDQRLGEESRPEVLDLAARTMERERRRTRPIVAPRDSEIMAARLVIELDGRLGDVSAPDRVALAAFPTTRERRAQDS